MEHYDEDGDSEWACGGDGDCDAVEPEPSCVKGYSHRWTGEGCGGIDENPGVWSLGGTTYTFERRCVLCGVVRHETHYGSQRNPGECDRRRYDTDACTMEGWPRTPALLDTEEAQEEAELQAPHEFRYRVFGRGRSQSKIFRHDEDANTDVPASAYPPTLRHDDGTVVTDAWCVDVVPYEDIEDVLDADPAVVRYSRIRQNQMR